MGHLVRDGVEQIDVLVRLGLELVTRRAAQRRAHRLIAAVVHPVDADQLAARDLKCGRLRIKVVNLCIRQRRALEFVPRHTDRRLVELRVLLRAPCDRRQRSRLLPPGERGVAHGLFCTRVDSLPHFLLDHPLAEARERRDSQYALDSLSRQL
eukprot:4824230-Prymnesium_polylepis.2